MKELKAVASCGNKDSQKYDVCIYSDGSYGYFENWHYGEEDGGGLWFENGELVDFDGVSFLPDCVADSIIELGFAVDKKQFCYSEDF